MRPILCSLLAILAFTTVARAYTSVSKQLNQPEEWYRSDAAKEIADNVLSWQTKEGGWPKNTDTGVPKPTTRPTTNPTTAPTTMPGLQYPPVSTTRPVRRPSTRPGAKPATKPTSRPATRPATSPAEDYHATFDNSAGFFEMQFLTRMYLATGDERYRKSFERSLEYILNAQYPTGGWPQTSPPPKGYGRYITFNDGSMQRLMFTLLDITKSDRYSFIDPDFRARCKSAFDRGIDCILKCQIKVDGKLTAWCAQHDEVDFSPKPARAFEPASLSGEESLSVMNVLMHVDNPSPEVIAAVDAAAAWFNEVKITGIRIEDWPEENTPRGYDRYVVEDPAAPALWARFYEIGTNKPIFMDRDSEVVYSLDDIDVERRTGYKWYGPWAKRRLETEYPAWKAKHTAPAK